MALAVASVWTGATTHTTTQVRAVLSGGGTATLLVADNEAMTGPASFGPVASGAGNVVTWNVTGLQPGTRYWTLIDDGALNPSFKSTFRTHPVAPGEPASYMFGAAGDAGLSGDGDEGTTVGAVSNGFVFDTMRTQCAAEEWVWFSHLGDLHYKNISTNDVAAFRSAYFETMNYGAFVGPDFRQPKFVRSVSYTYVWDDHDFGANNSDRTSASNPAANQAYREWVPSYPLPAPTTGIYQSWQVGRVLYIASDVRSFRDPNSDPQTPAKTMLGTGQKSWMEAVLSTARNNGAEALVWQSPSRWVGTTDTWSDFLHERQEMVQLFGDTGWLDRMVLMTADMHAVSMCSGPHNPYGRFPMWMFAGMDAGAWSSSVTDYDIGSVAGRRQYGTVRVTDTGHTIALAGTGYHDGTVLMSHTAYVHTGGRIFALDYAAGHISDPFEPTDDDQKLRNEITARREDGGEYTYSKATGPNNTGDPATDADAVGVYDEGVSVNVAADAQLPDQAAWRVALGTVDEDRYPMVRVDLAANPGLADSLTGLQLGDRITIVNPPEWLPPDQIEAIAEGGTEPIGHPIDWDMQLNASPGTPWLVAQLAEPATLVHAAFETDLESFTGEGGAAVARISSPGVPPFGGAWSCRITPDGVTASGGAVGPLTATSTVVAGQQYRISMWAYAAGGMADVRPGVHWHNDAGTLLSSDAPAQPALAAGVWTLLSAVVTAPANATRVKARAVHGGTPAASAIWYADELTVQEFTATGKAAGTDRPNRLDTSSSQLVNAVDADDTAFVVHTPPDGIFDRAPWIISAGLSDAPNLKPTHFPLDLKLGGETVRATALTPFGYDSFTRTVAAGSWGTSDGGQAWTLVGGAASERSVDGSRGLVALPSTPSTIRFQTLPDSIADCEIRARLSVDQVATGDSILPGVLMRYTNTTDFYRARLHFGLSGALSVSVTRGSTQIGSAVLLPHTYTAGAEFEIRARLIGHRILARVWRTGTGEPQQWHVDQTVTTSLITTGQIGVTASAFSGNTNVNPVCRFDRFEVITPQRATVTRSINTIAKGHAAAAPVSLARPAPVAL